MPKPAATNPLVSETQFDDHTVIVPPNRLRSVISRSGDSDGVTMDPVKRAETALKQIKKEFRGWMNAECDALEAARAAIRENGIGEDSAERLLNAAHDVLGHADTFGYPLAGKIADSLCKLISSTADVSALPMPLVDAHVDAVRAVVREGVHDADNRTGGEILRRLSKLIASHLDKVRESRLAALPEVDSPDL